MVAIKEKLEIGGENKYETVPHFLTQSRHCIIYQQNRNWRHRTEEIIHLLTLYQRALWLEPDGLRTAKRNSIQQFLLLRIANPT